MRTVEKIFVAANLGARPDSRRHVGDRLRQCVLRYTTNFSLVWAEEVARYLMVWMTFLGAGLGFAPAARSPSTICTRLCLPPAARLPGLDRRRPPIFFAVMIWFGYSTRCACASRRRRRPASPSAIYAAMPIGFALLIVHLLFIARRFIGDNGSTASQA